MLVPGQGDDGPKELRWSVHAIWKGMEMVDDALFARSLRDRVAHGEWATEAEITRMATLLTSCAQHCHTSFHVSETETRMVVLGMQFLANASVRPGEQHRLCWEAFYPRALLSVSSLKILDVLDPLCYALWNFMKSGHYCLVDEGMEIFERVVGMGGEEMIRGQTTTFALLINESVQRYPDCPMTSSSMIKALQGIDVSCLSESTVERVLSVLVDAAKKSGSRDILHALRNLVQCNKAKADILVEVTSWVLDGLSSRGTHPNLRTGYRTDLMALLCNLLSGRKYVQDRILDSDGLPYILDSIRLDEANPFMREWALLCIRHMCMENPQAQDYIRGLELKDVVSDDVLGANVEFDRLTGQFRAQKHR